MRLSFSGGSSAGSGSPPREGNKIRESLERALKLDPSIDDAYFGIGLYHYYAGVAPAAAKLLRWFVFLPGGDRDAGLQEMLRAYQGSRFSAGVRSSADRSRKRVPR